MSLDVGPGVGGGPGLQFRAPDAAGILWQVPSPIDIRFLGGDHVRGAYQEVTGSARRRVGTWRLTRGRVEWLITDTWSAVGPHHVHLDRVVEVRPAGGAEGAGRPPGQSEPGDDEAFHLRLTVEGDGPPGALRPFVPANVYEASQLPVDGVVSCSDGRLSYPLVASYDQQRGRVLLVLRAETGRYDQGPRRQRRQREFAQVTDIGSMFVGATATGVRLGADFPYYEGDRSAVLDSLHSPARAYHPVSWPAGAAPAGHHHGGFRLSYDVIAGPAANFSAAVRWAVGQAVRLSPPQPASLPFPLADAVRWRVESASRTYTEWDDGGAGFRLNFDPEGGYRTPARAFGASFTEHAMDGAMDIFEYGFTGRQLNLAWALARTLGGDWLDRGSRVCDFFVRNLSTPSGFVFSHYDTARRRPLFSVGDPGGPVLHYLGGSAESGSYLRLMTEAGSDLLLNWALHTQAGNARPHWLSAARRLGDFLVRGQNADGSWYRAYTPAGEGILGGTWLGNDAEAAKSSTAVAIPFLLDLAVSGGDGDRYVAAAERAGRFILDHQVSDDHYRGGTLDNPNVTDKESALLSMSALLSLHRYTDDRSYLTAAERAGRLGISWTSLWDVPPVPGTPLATARVRSTGWGGINSIWGAGVGDVYSLFFLSDLLELAERTRDELFASIAHLTAAGTAQLLSHPGDSFGFADTGMQPEGIAFCDQGVDDGLIAKGSTWGGLGWIYTAGTYGLGRYLERLAGAAGRF